MMNEFLKPLGLGSFISDITCVWMNGRHIWGPTSPKADVEGIRSWNPILIASCLIHQFCKNKKFKTWNLLELSIKMYSMLHFSINQLLRVEIAFDSVVTVWSCDWVASACGQSYNMIWGVPPVSGGSCQIPVWGLINKFHVLIIEINRILVLWGLFMGADPPLRCVEPIKN